MRTSVQFFFYFLLFSAMIFSQNRIPETKKNSLKGLKSDSIKSERSKWKDTFRAKQFNENNLDENTNIDKKLLETGFLLVEEIRQLGEGSAWVNDWKDSYTYDGYNNLTEFLEQSWVFVTWMMLIPVES